MEKLNKARREINEIDKQMAALFEERMKAVRFVAEYKAERGLPILDGGREAEIIRTNSSFVSDDDVRSYYVSFLKHNMELSKQYQHRLMEGLKVAYSGVEGAFAYIAARRIFPDGAAVSYPDFDSAYKAVANGECDVAVLPIENSYAGEVGQVMDLLWGGDLYVNGVYDLQIKQNLLGIEGARIEDIKRVVSHPQALSQCAAYIKERGFEQTQASNTAIAALSVLEKGDKQTAAIASAETARLYGLTVLDHSINESATNTTRFAVLSRIQNKSGRTKNSTFFLLFAVNHVAGALASAIGVIGRHDFNMKALRSRPMREGDWQYYFYVEAEGDEDTEAGKLMLDELKEHCAMLKVVGSYPAEIELKESEE